MELTIKILTGIILFIVGTKICGNSLEAGKEKSIYINMEKIISPIIFDRK